MLKECGCHLVDGEREKGDDTLHNRREIGGGGGGILVGDNGGTHTS